MRTLFEEYGLSAALAILGAVVIAGMRAVLIYLSTTNF